MSISTERVPAADLRPGDVIISGTLAYTVEDATIHGGDAVTREHIRLTLRRRGDDTLITRYLRPDWHINITRTSHAIV